MTATIALLTDFGLQDPFVGIMKGVMAARAPEVRFVDLTHDIPPGDIRRAAVVLWQSVPYFPPGTVFLVVVDPGVGTERKALLLETQGYRFVGPDNGVFTFVLGSSWKAWALENPYFRLEHVSTTFHGRDVFAPAAAHAALGVPGEAFGPPVTELVTLPRPRLELRQDVLVGEVLMADRFGNVLTSLGRFVPGEDTWLFSPWLGSDPILPVRLHRLRLPDGTALPLVRTFGELPEGEAGFLVGSTGLIEIVVNRGSAQERFGLAPGQQVLLELSLEEPQGGG